MASNDKSKYQTLVLSLLLGSISIWIWACASSNAGQEEGLSPLRAPILEEVPDSTSELILTIKGTTLSGATISVLGGAERATLEVGDPGGQFTIYILLKPGQLNFLEVTSTRQGSISPPALAEVMQTSPANPSSGIADLEPPPTPSLDPLPDRTTELEVIISGLTEPNCVIHSDGAGGHGEIQASSAGGFRLSHPMNPGTWNTIQVVAVDEAGNRSSPALLRIKQDLQTQTLDTTAPDAPVLDGLPTPTKHLAVTVTGHSREQVKIRITGGAVDAEGFTGAGNRFRVGVALRRNDFNHIRAVAVDAAGNESPPAFLTVQQLNEATTTKFPVVFVHGCGGFDELIGVDYFYRVGETLSPQGYHVTFPGLTAIAAIEVRAEQLKRHILELTSGKVNLIAHSQGGLDSRYMISRLGMVRQVASLTTISTPHRGSSVADVGLGLAPGPLETAADFLLKQMGMSIEVANQLTAHYMRESFNPATPNAPEVAYFSWTFHSDPTGLETGNRLLPLLIPNYLILKSREGENDGLVSIFSATWGQHLGTLPADHMNEVGQLLGNTGGFDHLAFYQREVQRLSAHGF